MNIALDMMGGDFAPEEAVKGVARFLSGDADGVHLSLIGDQERLKPLLSSFGILSSSFTVVHASQIIGMNEHPTKALRDKTQSSISIGFQLLTSKKTDAFISAGNTGAMLVGALYGLKTIEGVTRPAISTIIPKNNGATGLLLDVGINADCKPEQLNQFALLGSLYAQYISGIDSPRVGLINIGEEEGKGNILAQSAYPLLKANSLINFIGNIEGRDILLDKADVMVCEGFTGNIILKMAESIYEITHQKQIKDEYFERFNFEIYGGTPLLGVSEPVIIGHGISHALAFANMISVAVKMISSGLMAKIKSRFESFA